MRKGLAIFIAAFAILAIMGTSAQAGDEFEHGFKTELGAITARATVGLGAGLVSSVFHGGHGHRYYGHRRYGYGHHGYGHRVYGPRYSKVVVYRPYPPPPVRYVERRVVYYGPPRVYWPTY